MKIEFSKNKIPTEMLVFGIIVYWSDLTDKVFSFTICLFKLDFQVKFIRK